jgi:A/G-specific adenine glycosylase
MARHSPATKIKHLRRALGSWYDLNRRSLPWRRKRANPYHVLVSETMLQQTQVVTAIPYFKRFINAFPTLESLADADEQAVLRLWQGLGYYRRARMLHRTARTVVADCGGKIPCDVGELRQLPGVGPYTAAAIASIAFEKPHGVLDGNVSRVLARIFAVKTATDRPLARQKLADLSDSLAAGIDPGRINQAVMELGALVCLPKKPTCAQCPVASICEACLKGLTRSLPKRLPRRAPQRVTHHVAALTRGGRYLFESRPDRGLWAGMWQLPTAQTLGRNARDTDLGAWITENLGAPTTTPVPVCTFEHRTTHRTITFKLWKMRSLGAIRGAPGRTWRRLGDLDDLPLANPQRRAVSTLSG